MKASGFLVAKKKDDMLHLTSLAGNMKIVGTSMTMTVLPDCPCHIASFRSERRLDEIIFVRAMANPSNSHWVNLPLTVRWTSEGHHIDLNEPWLCGGARMGGMSELGMTVVIDGELFSSCDLDRKKGIPIITNTHAACEYLVGRINKDEFLKSVVRGKTPKEELDAVRSELNASIQAGLRTEQEVIRLRTQVEQLESDKADLNEKIASLQQQLAAAQQQS